MIESDKNMDKQINKELIIEAMLINQGPLKIVKTIIMLTDARIL